MEDREFELEQNKFTFEKAKHIDDMRFQTFGTLYRQLFAFNIGILTLIFFVIYQSLEYDVSRWLHFFLILAIAFSTASIDRIVRYTYANASKNLKLLTQELDGQNTKNEYRQHRLEYEKDGKYSYYFCFASWITVIFVIFWAIFTVDFKKEMSNNPSISDNPMSTRNVSNNLSGFDGKSFAQQTQKQSQIVIATAGQIFTQVWDSTQSKTQQSSSQKPQPQPESTTKQPSNKQ